MNERREDEIQLKWERRPGRPSRPKASTPQTSAIPRITRLMALAIKFQGMIDRGEIRDYAEVARLGFVTRARLTQIMNLCLLAPDIQERILDVAGTPLQTLNERQLRRISAVIRWADQRDELSRF